MLRWASRPVDEQQRYETRTGAMPAQVQALANAGAWAEISAYFKVKRNQKWSKWVKASYAKHQHRKCGYCERLVTDPGDVEHHRPKSAIFTLRAPGRERNNLNNVTRRTYNRHPTLDAWESGYWWLAYRWDNYLMACGRCNQQWKSALFPVSGGRPTRPTEGDEATEDALILDPYGDRDPAEHLEFLAGGGIRAWDNSNLGTQTIKVCGLDRPSLVTARLEKATKTAKALRTLLDPTDLATRKRTLEDILSMGDERYVHAGMVRAMFQQNTGWTWTQLVDFLS